MALLSPFSLFPLLGSGRHLVVLDGGYSQPVLCGLLSGCSRDLAMLGREEIGTPLCKYALGSNLGVTYAS